jgi:hypothetical protein
MNAILNVLGRLDDDQLLRVSEAIDSELDRRLERSDPIPESARRRAIDRQFSYRHCNGSAGAPVRFVGLRPTVRRRLAA